MKMLSVGQVSSNGQVEIIGEDKYCYLVKSKSKGAEGERTINKKLLEEFVEFFRKYPNATSSDAREELSGKSTIDKFEYGYNSTLTVMAKMVLENEKSLAKIQSKIALDKKYGPLQQIFYGAPGTGKSFTVNKVTKVENHIRTTFHPDTDYASFVGAYKPVQDMVELYDELGQNIQINGKNVYKSQIVYKFVAQSFLKAYVEAWKKYALAKNDAPIKQFLIIEEINRGNCAQIFGDIFQLLDRNDYGFSVYPIHTDADMKKYLKEQLSGLTIGCSQEINNLLNKDSDRYRDYVNEVLEGDIFILPNNLYIWATMNTSDQSLFPIDSAFKRRWEWKYMPIANENHNWYIEVGNNKYDWWSTVEAINAKIGTTTSSEDKKLGYFFAKPENGSISADRFVSKVIFYLWNDVFKDYDFDDAIFNDEKEGKLTFDKFFIKTGKDVVIAEEKVILFLKNLGISPL